MCADKPRNFEINFIFTYTFGMGLISRCEENPLHRQWNPLGIYVRVAAPFNAVM